MKEKSIATPHKAALAVRGKVIPGVDHSVDFPSIYDIEDMDVSNNWTTTAVNESAYNAATEELDVKLRKHRMYYWKILSLLQDCHHPQLQTDLVLVNNSLCHRMSTTFMYSMTTTRVFYKPKRKNIPR